MSYNPQPVGRLTNYSSLNDSDFDKQEISTTLVELNSTALTYTPTSTASAVLFDVSYGFAWNPDRYGSFLSMRVQYSLDDVTWTDIDSTRTFVGDGLNVYDSNWHLMSVSYTLPTWSGARYLRLAGQAYSSSTETTWGRAYTIAGSNTDGFCPMISVYCVEPV
mgnify:CR=1 FL=1